MRLRANRIAAWIVLLLAATPVWADEDKPPVPSRSQIRVSQLFGWQPLDNQSLLLWTGKEEVWQVGVSPECPELMRTRRIAVTTDSHHIKAGRDHVQAGNQSCTIDEFTMPDASVKKRYRVPRKKYSADLSIADTESTGKSSP